MRIRLLFHQYRLILPVTQPMREKTVKELTDFVSEYLQQHFNNKLISILGLSTSDRYSLNPSDIVQDVIMDNEVLICLDDQLILEREIKVYCDRKNPWLHVERKKQPKARKRRSSTVSNGSAATGDKKGSEGRRQSNVSIAAETSEEVSSSASPAKWAEVGYNTRNKLYVMLGVGNYIKLFLFSVDDLRANGFQEKRIGIIEDETGDWYTLAKFEKERPENLKRRIENEEGEEIEVPDEDEVIAAIGLHVKAEGDQMANAEQIIIRVTKDGLLTTDASEVFHLFGTKSGKRPRRKRQTDDNDELWLHEEASNTKVDQPVKEEGKVDQ